MDTTALYAYFNIKILLNFFVEIIIKTDLSNLLHFQEEINHSFFLRNLTLRRESVKSLWDNYKLCVAGACPSACAQA